MPLSTLDIRAKIGAKVLLANVFNGLHLQTHPASDFDVQRIFGAVSNPQQGVIGR